jgi:hypothetical protein
VEVELDEIDAQFVALPSGIDIGVGQTTAPDDPTYDGKVRRGLLIEGFSSLFCQTSVASSTSMLGILGPESPVEYRPSTPWGATGIRARMDLSAQAPASESKPSPAVLACQHFHEWARSSKTAVG